MHDFMRSSDVRYLCAAYLISHLDIAAGLAKGNLNALDAVGLPAAHAQQAPVLGNGDRIALHMLHAQPGKAQVSQLCLARLLLRHRLEVNA